MQLAGHFSNVFFRKQNVKSSILVFYRRREAAEYVLFHSSCGFKNRDCNFSNSQLHAKQKRNDTVKQTRKGGGEYSHIFAIRICAAGKGMVFKPFDLV